MKRLVTVFLSITLLGVVFCSQVFAAKKLDFAKVYEIKELGLRVVLDDISKRENRHLYVHRVIAVQHGGAAFVGKIQPGDIISYYIINGNRGIERKKVVEALHKMETALSDIAQTVKVGDYIDINLVWYDGNKRLKAKPFSARFRGFTEGNWITTGGTNGVISNDGRPNLPGVVALIKKFRNKENFSALRKEEASIKFGNEFKQEVLAKDLSHCETSAVDELLRKNGIDKGNFTRSIFRSEYVPPLGFLKKEMDRLYRCIQPTVRAIYDKYKELNNGKDPATNFNIADRTNNEWVRRYGKVPVEYVKQYKLDNRNRDFLNVVQLFYRSEDAGNLPPQLETLLGWIPKKKKSYEISNKTRPGQYALLRKAYLEKSSSTGQALSTLEREGYLLPDSDKSDRELIVEFLDGVEDNGVDLGKVRAEVRVRLRTLNLARYSSSGLEAAFKGAGRSGFGVGNLMSNMISHSDKINVIDNRMWRLRAALNAVNGKICKAPISVQFCQYSTNTQTTFLGRGFVYDYTDVTNTCSGFCSGVNGWCDASTGDEYSSFIDAENSHCRSATLETIRSEILH